MNNQFKAKISFKDRKEESLRIISKYENKIPIICQKHYKSILPNSEKYKYLVEQDFTLGHFIYVIRRRIKLPPEQAIYMFIKGHIISSNETIRSIYNKYVDEDGFLYMYYTNENTFGDNIK
jgi:GABA(A) receptor-associated protein